MKLQKRSLTLLSIDQQHDEPEGRARTFRSERDQLLQILMQTNLRLQEFSEERTNFLARSIHDVRSSLTAIGGYCDLLLDGPLEPLTDDQRQVVERMRHSTRRLKCTADTMFRLTISQNPDVKLNLRWVDIQGCVGRVLQDLSCVLEDRNVSVTVEVAPSPEGLLFEPPQIEEVLFNLIENACKFSAKGGTIEIRGYPFFWEQRGGQATPHGRAQHRLIEPAKSVNSYRVDICDSGPRIPTRHVERIFEEITPYSGGHDRSGAGLSLESCRIILSLHGGHVWAESAASGNVFSFVLPLRQVDIRGFGRENGSIQPRALGSR